MNLSLGLLRNIRGKLDMDNTTELFTNYYIKEKAEIEHDIIMQQRQDQSIVNQANSINNNAINNRNDSSANARNQNSQEDLYDGEMLFEFMIKR